MITASPRPITATEGGPPSDGRGVSDAPDALAQLGRAIFFDPELSEPRGTSCASCHDPARAFSGANGSTTGVPRGSRPGHFARRSVPSVLYLKYTPKFYFHEDDDGGPVSPIGGLFWDGRVDTIAELARQPLLNPNEMNNPGAPTVAAKLARAPYAEAFRHHFGDPRANPAEALAALGTAIEAFLTSPEMAPFSSRFDAFVTGRSKLTPHEMHGMRLFKDPAKGGCGACHRFYESSREPSRSMFTDYGYDAVGVPRNPKLRVEGGAGRPWDLGLCERTDPRTPSNQPMYCAAFRTPSLRNVAVRPAFMHNGAFTSLREVVSFYATRATDPRRWYKSGVKFDDAPAKFRGQINVSSIPYNRRQGDQPALDETEIDAIVAFLQTLTDAPYVTSVGSAPEAPPR